MRNINRPLALLMSTAALAGGVPAIAQAEAAGQAPVSTPEMFQECAQIALSRSVEHPSADGGPVTVFRSFTKDQAGFGLAAKQDSPMVAANGTECTGVATLKDGLQIKTGSFTQAISGAEVKIIYDNQLINAGRPAKDLTNGVFSYRRACEAAKSRKVSLVMREDRTYTEAGYRTATQTTSTLVKKLPCIKSHHGKPSEPIAHAS